MTNWRVRLPVMAAEEPGCLRDKTAPLSIADMKARQAAKISEIGEALMSVGLVTLDAQANALGLPRSTTWTILTAEHKGYGISAKIISRMLNSEHTAATCSGENHGIRPRKSGRSLRWDADAQVTLGSPLTKLAFGHSGKGSAVPVAAVRAVALHDNTEPQPGMRLHRPTPTRA